MTLKIDCNIFQVVSSYPYQSRWTALRQDNQLIVITHLNQLIILVTGFGSLTILLILVFHDHAWSKSQSRRNTNIPIIS